MMTRMVMMKMIRSTNITSTRGVTLMSAIAWASSSPTVIAMSVLFLAGGGGRVFADCSGRLVHPQAHLGARDQVGMQFMGEVGHHLLHTFIAAQQNVVTQHRRHRDGQTDGGHDQCLADGSRHLV